MAARTLKPRSIGIVIFEQFQLLDVAGPIGAFEMPMRGLNPSPYALSVVAPRQPRAFCKAEGHAERPKSEDRDEARETPRARGKAYPPKRERNFESCARNRGQCHEPAQGSEAGNENRRHNTHACSVVITGSGQRL